MWTPFDLGILEREPRYTLFVHHLPIPCSRIIKSEKITTLAQSSSSAGMVHCSDCGS